jgi:ribonuclease HI
MSSESHQLTFESQPGGDGDARTRRRDAVVVYSDGGARGNPGPAAIGAVVLDPSPDPPTTLASVSRCIGVATNNVAEYEALIAGLEAAAPFGARAVRVRADSQLLIRQLEGRYKVKHAALRPLHARAQALLAGYEHVDLMHVPREENTVADALVNAALDAPGAGGDDPSGS